MVNENENAGTFVSFVTINDGDMGTNGKFVAAVRPKEKVRLIPDDIEGSLILVSKFAFDREEKDFYNATITACDEGIPKK